MEPRERVVVVAVGGSMQLTCRLDCAGPRAASVQWRGLDTSLGAVQSGAGSSVLSVRNASLSTAGTRVCVGSCGNLTFQQTVKLLVFGETPSLLPSLPLHTQDPTSCPALSLSLCHLFLRAFLDCPSHPRSKPASKLLSCFAIRSDLLASPLSASQPSLPHPQSSPKPPMPKPLPFLLRTPLQHLIFYILATQGVAAGSPCPCAPAVPISPCPLRPPHPSSSGPSPDPLGSAHPPLTLLTQPSQTS